MDRVRFLPGASELLSRQYSGFLDVTPERHMHYYYVESENDPESDSIIFWTNGGPGCSGFLGLFSEMGPWRTASNGNLISNPYSWSKMANMVFFEQPIGVGYSYDETDPNPDNAPVGDGENGVRGNVPFGDYHAVADMVAAMVAFFEKYPERLSNKIYIASESYGGHYIPELTLALLNKMPIPSILAKKPKLNSDLDLDLELNATVGTDNSNTNINTTASASSYNHTLTVLQSLHDRFSGYIVGNPYVSFASGEVAGALTAWGYQILPKPLWDEFTRNNCHILSINAYKYGDRCWNLLYAIDTQIMVGSGLLNVGVNSSQKVPNSALVDHGLNIYALDFPTCPNGTGIDSRTSSVIPASPRGHARAKQYFDNNRRSNQGMLLRKMIMRLKAARSSRTSKRQLDTNLHLNSGAVAKLESEFVSQRSTRVLSDAYPHSLPSSDALVDYNPCTAFNAVGYLNRKDVKLALNLYRYENITVQNISTSRLVLLDRNWTMCNNKIFDQWPLADMFSDTTPLYQEIHERVMYKSRIAPNEASKAHWDSFKMLIFSGDADGVCATIGTQHWVYNITGQMIRQHFNCTGDISSNCSSNATHGYASFKNDSLSNSSAAYETLWQPWNAYGQQAGSISLLSPHLAFVTVHDAGHEVPAYQPARALVLLGHYLTGELFDKNSDLLHGPNTGVNREPNGVQTVDPVVSDIIVLLISLTGLLTFLMFFCRVRTPKPKVIDSMDDEDTIEMQQSGNPTGNMLNENFNPLSTSSAEQVLRYESEDVEDVK